MKKKIESILKKRPGRDAVLFTRIKEENKQWIKKNSDQNNVSASFFVDRCLDIVRTKFGYSDEDED